MSLGLPGHLAPRIVALGVARGENAIAAVCLFMATVALSVVAAGGTTPIAWLAPAAIVAIGALLVLLERRRILFVAGAYVLLGGVALFVAAAAMQGSGLGGVEPVRDAIVGVHVALIMVGGVSASLRLTSCADDRWIRAGRRRDVSRRHGDGHPDDPGLRPARRLRPRAVRSSDHRAGPNDSHASPSRRSTRRRATCGSTPHAASLN